MKVTKAKKNGKAVRREWTKADIRELKAHSKAKTPVAKISRETKRTIGALRQKALHLGIGLWASAVNADGAYRMDLHGSMNFVT